MATPKAKTSALTKAKTYTSPKTGAKYFLDTLEKRLTLNDKVVKKGKTELTKPVRKIVESTTKGRAMAQKQTKRLEASNGFKSIKKIPIKGRGGFGGGGIDMRDANK